MNWLKTDEGKKQTKLNFKSNHVKKGRPQKRKANNKSGGRDQKTKFRKEIKTDQCLKSIVSTIDNEDQTSRALISVLSTSSSQTFVPGNKHLVSELSACNSQPYSTALLVRPPSRAAAAAGMTFGPPNQDTIATVAQYFPATNVKLQSILKKSDAPCISDQGSCAM